MSRAHHLMASRDADGTAHALAASEAKAPPSAKTPISVATAAARPNETPLQRLERLVRLVAAGTIHVLITGETGVGKEVVAERIHRTSRRAAAPFVRVSAAAPSRESLELEIFGTEEEPGLFERADGGTILLDEIAELPLPTQAKLLRVVERREVLRVGSAVPRTIDVRFIAATNRDLGALVLERAFREDLFFRLDGITIEVPPLRERREQIGDLARELLAKSCAEAGRVPPLLGSDAIARLETYSFPGNVRELRNLLERALLLSTGDAIDPETLPGGDERAMTGPRLRSNFASERERIALALERCAGNQTKAAQLLGISRRTLVSRLGEYDLPRPRGGGRK